MVDERVGCARVMFCAFRGNAMPVLRFPCSVA